MKRSAQLAFLVLIAVAKARGAQAQAGAPAPADRSATTVAGPEYDAGPFMRALLGSGWRSVWTSSVTAPVFDMSRFAGGVRPTERGGGNQTISLRFREVNGWREHHFRSVNKDPVTQAMPAAVQGTLVGDYFHDLTSSLFPGAGLLLPPLLGAVGILNVTPALYIMPDDPRLGEHRKIFAGMLGTVELSPQEAPDSAPGFAGSRRIENGEDFLKIVEESRENRLDEREFFAVRLVDFLVNDNDRTADNIRFARFGEKGAWIWRPVPRDRDRAFTDAGGWVVRFLIRPVYPKLIEFGPRYSLGGLIFESHDLDRRLLQRITRRDAEEIALRVQAALDDTVIDRAIASLPVEWREESEDRLRPALRARRDQLPAVARDFYAWLATEVDIHGTDEADRAIITRHDDGNVTVTLRGKSDAASAVPFSRRTFLPSETDEVRVYLHSGNDEAVVNGASNSTIAVRVIGGGGDDVLADSAGGGRIFFYDTGAGNRFITRRGASVNLKEWKVPRQGQGPRFDAPWRPDWGSSISFGPAFGWAHGGGPLVGFGPRYTSRGFRRLPHRLTADAAILLALGNLKTGVRANADYRAENSPVALTLAASATKFEEFRFHGYGNDIEEVDRRLSRIEQDVITFEPRFVYQVGWRSREDLPSGFGDSSAVSPVLRPLVGRIEAGPVVFWNRPDPPSGSPLSDPAITGGESLGRAGFRVGVSLDRTSSRTPTDNGWTLDAEVAGYPPIWDLESSFGTAAATVTTYVPVFGNGTHLAFRAGGEHATGTFPVQHAPAIGGKGTLRGYGRYRYAGETSAFGSAELRVPVGILPLFVKWNAGVFGLADAGRVWFDDRSAGGWHTGLGGGVWISALGQTFSVAYAHGEDHRVYLKQGMSF